MVYRKDREESKVHCRKKEFSEVLESSRWFSRMKKTPILDKRKKSRPQPGKLKPKSWRLFPELSPLTYIKQTQISNKSQTEIFALTSAGCTIAG